MKLKSLLICMAFLTVVSGANASVPRILDGQEITNGSFILTLPSITDTISTTTEAEILQNKTISGASNTLSNIPTSAISSGQLGVSNGGTGDSTFTLNGILFGNTTSALSVTAAGTQYQVLNAGASGVPAFDAVHLDQSAAITGLLPLTNGGTGASTQSGAANAVLPSQTSNSGKFLTTNGTNVSWGSVSVSPVLTGSTGTPSGITAAGGIGFTGSAYNNIWFIQGSPGAVTVSASPQIAVGSAIGQQLVLIGQSNTNTVEIQDGNGLALNGPWIGALDSVLTLLWDGTTWDEVSRR